MALPKGGNFAPKIVLITAINQTFSHALTSRAIGTGPAPILFISPL